MNNKAVAANPGGESVVAFSRLMAEAERSGAVEPRLAVLAAIRDGVITGEGPTTAGRIHFSRSIDALDTALVGRILLTEAAAPITRPEADALFDIHEAAIERLDGGAFDELFARAIAQHVMAALGQPVPARATALATSLADWAQPVAVDGEIAAWLKARLNRKRRYDGSIAVLAAWVGATARSLSTGALDLAA